MIDEVVKASNETISLEREEFLLVVDLFLFRPELQLEVTGAVSASSVYLDIWTVISAW